MSVEKQVDLLLKNLIVCSMSEIALIPGVSEKTGHLQSASAVATWVLQIYGIDFRNP